MGAKRNLDKVPPEIAQAKYSGPGSDSFWRRINRINFSSKEVVSVDFLSDEKLRTIIALILDEMKMDIVRERTPDYETFELRPRKRSR
jgi:hypothetical protein